MRLGQSGRRWLLGLAGIVAGWLVLGSIGCVVEEPPPPPPSDPELRAALGIEDEVTIHRIELSGAGERPPIQPDSLVVLPGDVVQFVVLDHQAHLLRFQEDRIAPALLDFLRSTAQDRPPPLVDQGARLVLSFQEAPTGIYPFQIEGNGVPATGRIRVVAP